VHQLRERVALRSEDVPFVGRKPVTAHERDEPFGRAFRAPGTFALCVVDPALMNRRSGELRKRDGAADVVGMEVRDDDSLDRSVEPDKRFAPLVGRVVDTETRVDDRPPVPPA